MSKNNLHLGRNFLDSADEESVVSKSVQLDLFQADSNTDAGILRRISSLSYSLPSLSLLRLEILALSGLLVFSGPTYASSRPVVTTSLEIKGEKESAALRQKAMRFFGGLNKAGEDMGKISLVISSEKNLDSILSDVDNLKLLLSGYNIPIGLMPKLTSYFKGSDDIMDYFVLLNLVDMSQEAGLNIVSKAKGINKTYALLRTSRNFSKARDIASSVPDLDSPIVYDMLLRASPDVEVRSIIRSKAKGEAEFVNIFRDNGTSDSKWMVKINPPISSLSNMAGLLMTNIGLKRGVVSTLYDKSEGEAKAVVGMFINRNNNTRILPSLAGQISGPIADGMLQDFLLMLTIKSPEAQEILLGKFVIGSSVQDLIALLHLTKSSPSLQVVIAKKYPGFVVDKQSMSDILDLVGNGEAFRILHKKFVKD